MITGVPTVSRSSAITHKPHAVTAGTVPFEGRTVLRSWILHNDVDEVSRVQHLYAMTPVINVQFRRQAFIARGDRHCRITIDDSLATCRARDLFETMTSARPLLAQMNAVLEIKVGRTVPFRLNRLIRKYRLQVASICKYNHTVANGPFGLDGVCQARLLPLLRDGFRRILWETGDFWSVCIDCTVRRGPVSCRLAGPIADLSRFGAVRKSH